LIFWIIVGLSVPTLLSAGLIAIGSPEAVDKVKYQTGLTRWQGVYTNPHNFGHSMTLLLMTSVLYVILWGRHEGKQHGVSPRVENVLLGISSLHCIVSTGARSLQPCWLADFLGLRLQQNKKACC
jgi:hypothetical protein